MMLLFEVCLVSFDLLVPEWVLVRRMLLFVIGCHQAARCMPLGTVVLAAFGVVLGCNCVALLRLHVTSIARVVLLPLIRCGHDCLLFVWMFRLGCLRRDGMVLQY